MYTLYKNFGWNRYFEGYVLLSIRGTGIVLIYARCFLIYTNRNIEINDQLMPAMLIIIWVKLILNDIVYFIKCKQ